MKLGGEVRNSTRSSLNTKKMEVQRTGNISKCSQRKKKKKINTTNSYLQKTLEAYNIQTQDKRNSFVCNENCTRDEKNGSFYRYRGLYMYMRKIN